MDSWKFCFFDKTSLIGKVEAVPVTDLAKPSHIQFRDRCKVIGIIETIHFLTYTNAF